MRGRHEGQRTSRSENSVGDFRHKLCSRSPRLHRHLQIGRDVPLHSAASREKEERCRRGPTFLRPGIGVRSLQPRWMLPHLTQIRAGKLEGSTINFDEQQTAELLKSGPVRFSAVGAEFEYLITVGEDKKLKVWELPGPKLRSQRSAFASASIRSLQC